MADDLRDIVPQPMTAKQLAQKNGWPEAKAIFLLEAFVTKGLASKDSDDRYTITGLGLAAGEKVGVVKPLKEWPGVNVSGQSSDDPSAEIGEDNSDPSQAP